MLPLIDRILSDNGATLASIGLPTARMAHPDSDSCDHCDEDICVICNGGPLRGVFHSTCDVCIDKIAVATALPFDWADFVESATFVPP
eukprot:gene6473-6325_t